MRLIADFHLHSHYSRATSKEMNISSLYRWAKIKGINILGTGDFTHPQWFLELKEKLEPAENGLYKLKDKFANEEDKLLPNIFKDNPVRFILTAEISNIYSKNGKVRKLHHIVVAPSLLTVSKINIQLTKIGNLHSDGRPILGLDSKNLLKICLETDPLNLMIPAHIWTPWFALFGSKSGFDTLEEAFEDLTPNIHAVETGLSSDPFMNWRLSGLDKLTIISNSDAHSPAKLGREANILDVELSYQDVLGALKTNDNRFTGTIEFYPAEGKYHWDGHRTCGIRFRPSETKKHHGICPKCGKALVVGVESRVDILADRPENYKPKNHKQVEYIIPLVELLAEIFETKSINSKKVQQEYSKLTSTFGDEFKILRQVPTEEFKRYGNLRLSIAIHNMRCGIVHLDPGFDGVFGIISALGGDKAQRKLVEADIAGQLGLGI